MVAICHVSAPIMKIITALLYSLSIATTALAAPKESECEILSRVKLSFYGQQDTTDPIAYPECGRKSAGGRGTYESPITMASAPGAFRKCEVLYIPYLMKYVRFEDICLDCVTDWSKGKMHMQIWTGNTMVGGQEQTQCEKDLTPSHGMAVIQNPGRGQLLDTTPLYSWGAIDPCRLAHRYRILNINVFCFGKKDRPSIKDMQAQQRQAAQAMGQQYEQVLQEEIIYEQPAAAAAVSELQLQEYAEPAWGLYHGPEPQRQLQQDDRGPKIILEGVHD